MNSAPGRHDAATIAALRPLPVPAPLRAGMRVVDGVSPDLAARLARRLFFTPPRHRPRPEQRAILARGQRLEFATREGRVVGWSWGRGETVLLLHGWGGHAGQLTPYVEALVERKFRVLALDLPAHGESPGRQASVRHFAGAIEDAARPFAPLAGIVSHSFGGAASTLAFDRGLYARGAVFVAPPLWFGTFFARAVEGFGLGADTRGRLERLAEDWVGSRFDEIEPAALARRQDVPLWIAHDRGDDEVPFVEAEELARRWPGASLYVTDGLGHYRILRDPGVVERAADFLARAER